MHNGFAPDGNKSEAILYGTRQCQHAFLSILSYVGWLSNLVITASDLTQWMVMSSIPGRHTIGWVVLGWVTIFGQAYHLSM